MNGWNSDKTEGVKRVLDECYELSYEIENCIKGAYSGCETYADLGAYIKEVAERLATEAECLANEEEDPEDDEDEE